MKTLKESLMSRVKKSSDIEDIKQSIDKAEEFTNNEIITKVFQKNQKTREELLKYISIKNKVIYIDYQNKKDSLIHKDIIINMYELCKTPITRIECINVQKNENFIGEWYRIYLRLNPNAPKPSKPIIFGSSPGGIRMDNGLVDNVDLELYNFFLQYNKGHYHNNIYATLGIGDINTTNLFGSNMANQIYRVCTEKYKRPKDLDDLDTILRCKESVDILFKDLKSKNLTNTFLCDKNYNWFDKMVGFAVCDDQKMVRQIKIQYYDFWSKVNEYNFDNNITTLVFKNYDLDKYKGISHK